MGIILKRCLRSPPVLLGTRSRSVKAVSGRARHGREHKSFMSTEEHSSCTCSRAQSPDVWCEDLGHDEPASLGIESRAGCPQSSGDTVLCRMARVSDDAPGPRGCGVLSGCATESRHGPDATC